MDRYITLTATKQCWKITFVYGFLDRVYRDSLWNDLIALRLDESMPWCCIGDFNAIRSSTDKLGGCTVMISQVSGFNAFIQCYATL